MHTVIDDETKCPDPFGYFCFYAMGFAWFSMILPHSLVYKESHKKVARAIAVNS